MNSKDAGGVDKKLSGKEFLEAVFDAIYEADTANEEAIREALREAGYDPERLVEDGMAKIKKLQERQAKLQQTKLQQEN